MRCQLLMQLGAGSVATDSEVRQSGGRICREVEAIEVVKDRHVKGRRDGAFLLVPTHVNIAVIRAAVGSNLSSLSPCGCVGYTDTGAHGPGLCGCCCKPMGAPGIPP